MSVDKLSGRTEVAEAPPAAVTRSFALHPPRSSKALDPSDTKAFQERLQAFRLHHAALPEPQHTGGLLVLDTEQIRLRFESRWSGIRDKAYAIMEAVIERWLGPNDLYLALPDGRFFLFMTDLGRDEAEVRARLIAGELTGRLCGMVPGGVACHLKTTGFDLVAGLDGVGGPAALDARFAAFERAAEQAEQQLFEDHAGGLEPAWLPVLNLKKRLVSAFVLEPVLRRPCGTTIAAAELCVGSYCGVYNCAVDCWAVAAVAARLVRTPRSRTVLVLPIRYETLATMRHREPLVRELRRLPAESKRRVIVEIADLPPALPQARVRELMGYLKPFVIGMMVRVRPALLDGRTPITEHLENAGIIGLALHGREVDALPDGADTAGMIGHLRQAAAAAGLRTVCAVDDRRDLARAAAAAPVDHLYGRLVLPPTTEPGRALSLRR